MSVEDDIISAAEEVHKELGAGFTEAVYHRAFEHELSSRGIGFSSEGTIPIFYKGTPVGRRRPDLFVNDGDEKIVVELKAGSDSGDGQLLQYLDLLESDNNLDISKGILIKFNDTVDMLIKDVDN
jgi:GxxExxY protein